MALSERIAQDLKTAMKARQEVTVSCLRLVRNAIAVKEKKEQRSLEEPEVIAILKTQAKQRIEAASQFREGGRDDLADIEERELAVIKAYLPQMLTEDQIKEVLDKIFNELQPSSMKDMGSVMKAAMAATAGKADGKLVSEMVRKRLG